MPTKKPRQSYRNASGEKIPSVTGVTGRYQESGGLIYWANQVGLGEDESCADQERCGQCGRRPGKPHREVATRAADIGSYAHDLIEHEVKGVSIDEEYWEFLDPEQRAAADQCLSGFRRWVDGLRLTFIETELRLVSEKHQFGGMVDSIARTDGGALILPDWKTSKGLFPNMLSQIAGYGILVNETDIFGEVEEYHILRISKKTASFHHHSWTAESFEPARQWFLKALALKALEKPLKDLTK